MSLSLVVQLLWPIRPLVCWIHSLSPSYVLSGTRSLECTLCCQTSLHRRQASLARSCPATLSFLLQKCDGPTSSQLRGTLHGAMSPYQHPAQLPNSVHTQQVFGSALHASPCSLGTPAQAQQRSVATLIPS